MAMEMAMMVMVVAIALGALMVTVALMQDNSTRVITKDFEEKLELEQIGESFCEYVVANGEEPFSYAGYEVSVEKTTSGEQSTSTLTVKKAGESDVVMTVAVSSSGGTYEIVQWEIK